MNRLTDNDKNWGPFIFARTNWQRFSIIYSTELQEGEERGLQNTLTVYAFGRIMRLNLPRLIRPFAVKVKAGWDTATVARMGRDYYFNYFEREYGFSLSDGDFFQLHYGVQSGFGSLPEGIREKSWCKHLPWRQWDCVRHSLYDTEGNHFYTEEKGKDFRVWMNQKDACPKCHFAFKDYDEERIIASCMITEMEWHKGEGWFKWLKYFTKPKIRRTLDLAFSAEVGPQKGSWKGGTIGHGIEMFSGETPEQAFRRYCAMDHERKGKKFSLKFIGPCDPPPPKKIIKENTVDFAKS